MQTEASSAMTRCQTSCAGGQATFSKLTMIAGRSIAGGQATFSKLTMKHFPKDSLHSLFSPFFSSSFSFLFTFAPFFSPHPLLFFLPLFLSTCVTTLVIPIFVFVVFFPFLLLSPSSFLFLVLLLLSSLFFPPFFFFKSQNFSGLIRTFFVSSVLLCLYNSPSAVMQCSACGTYLLVLMRHWRTSLVSICVCVYVCLCGGGVVCVCGVVCHVVCVGCVWCVCTHTTPIIHCLSCSFRVCLRFRCVF
jgi:hypothetical protein